MDQLKENLNSQSKHYINTTCEILPANSRTNEQTQIFLGCKIDPFKEKQINSNLPSIPLYGFHSLTNLKQCNKCRGYINPWVELLDGGRTWNCNFCGFSNTSPNEYFSSKNKVGTQLDHTPRPELMSSVIDYQMESNKKSPLFVFLIDVSLDSIKNGIISTIADTLYKQLENNFQKVTNTGNEKENEKGKEEGSNISVGFITYNSTVHLHYLSSTNQNPQEGKGSDFQPKKSRMYILPDNKDIYLPYRNGMFTKLDKNGKMLLKNFLKSLNKMFESTRDRGSCLGSRKKDTEKEKEQEKKNEPEQEQEPEKGKKSSRRKSKVNTEKEIVGSTLEMQLLTPNAHNGEFYSTVSKILASSGHTFFLFLFGKEYLDIATLSQLAINSNGEIFYYPRIDFQKRPDISKTFSSNLKKIVTQWYSNNITTRTRVSHNIMIKNTYGYHGIKSTLASKKIPTMTSYNSIMFGISVRPTNNIPNNAAIQLVIIYSLQSGEERLRIITRQFKTSNDFGLLFRSINLDLLYHFYLQVGLRSFNVYSSKKIVSTLINNCKQLIKNSIQGKKYDNNLRYPPMKNSNRLKDGNVEVKGQERKSEIEERVGLIKKLPDSLKLVAFYTCSLVKSSMFGKPTFMNINDRSFLLGHFFKNNLIETKSYICPLFYSLPIDLQNYHNSQPIRIPLTKKSLKIDGLFLMTNSQEILFLIGNKINSKIINYLFDLGSIENIEPNLLTLLKLKNKYNKYVWNFIQQIQHLYFRKIPIHFIKFGLQRKIENEYINWFVEDQTPSSPSYQDFISTLEITLNDF